MLLAPEVGVPPAGQDVAIHGEVVGDDVEVPGGGELVERVVDATVAECFGGVTVVGVAEPVGGGEFGGVGGVVLVFGGVGEL